MTDDDIPTFAEWASALPDADRELLDRFAEASCYSASCEGDYADLRDRLVTSPLCDRMRYVAPDAIMRAVVPLAALARDLETGASPLEIWEQGLAVCAIRTADGQLNPDHPEIRYAADCLRRIPADELFSAVDWLIDGATDSDLPTRARESHAQVALALYLMNVRGVDPLTAFESLADTGRTDGADEG